MEYTFLIDTSSKGQLCYTYSGIIVIYCCVQLASVTTSLCSPWTLCYTVKTPTDFFSHVDSHVAVYILNCYNFKTAY